MAANANIRILIILDLFHFLLNFFSYDVSNMQIVDLEEKKKEALDNEAKIRKRNQAITSSTSNDNILKKQSINDIFEEDFEELMTDQSICSESQLKFDLCFEGCD
ncbi:hypothetical protein A4A49_14866 [Nicotiana attenuata]|uniref:Uncharacterized protein n=1 Tax=Nicotiana attenuata TaxID=49451 RepID=A0A314KZ97_NICAT|nr:hypothetical protein A4A49_14866 [Nicotiana attenuata]